MATHDQKETWQKYRDDPRSTQELIELALEKWGDEEDHEHWKAVTVLHFKGSHEILLAAQGLCSSEEPAKRGLGATILAQLGVPERTYPDECVTILIEMLEQETDADVLTHVLIAFGHLRDKRSIEPMSQLRDHPDSTVREALAFGLTGIEDDKAIEVLLGLMEDTDPATRDWATFAIGRHLDIDTSEIRAALFNNLDDEDEIVRFEALAGLARRKDTRILDKLVDDLIASVHTDLWDLCEGLEAMKEQYTGDPEKLAKALVICSDDEDGEGA